MSNSVKEANVLFQSGSYQDALDYYIKISNDPRWRDLLNINILLCKEQLGIDCKDEFERLSVISNPEIFITLTTIKSRLAYLTDIINSLLKQTLLPVRIDINISTDYYLLDEGIKKNVPILYEIEKNSLVKINWVKNTRPYRKIFPFLEEHFSQSKAYDKIFVTVDDDTLYPDYFLKSLYQKYLEHDCVIAYRGRHLELE